MVTGQTILIQKKLTSTGVVYPAVGKGVNIENTFSIVALNTPLHGRGKVKEPYKNDFKDEDGEDTYIPDVLVHEAYDVEFEFGYKGGLKTAYTAYKAFADFLTGRDGHGADLSIYDPRTGIGKSGCWFKELDDMEFTYNNLEDVVTWTCTFRVTKPMSDVELGV